MSKTEFDKRKGAEFWLHCNACKRGTSHRVLTGVDYSDHDEDDGFVIDWWHGCDIVQCGGCKGITFTKRATDSESYYPGQEKEIEHLPPKEEARNQHIENEIYELPILLQRIYKETLHAINNKLFTLAGIGMRAILEILCKDKRVKGRDLEKRIDGLADKGFLTTAGADILHGIRLIGNDAAHDAKAPKKAQIDAAMKVIDHLILGIYIIPEEASSVLPKRAAKTVLTKTKKATPKPKKRVKRAKK